MHNRAERPNIARGAQGRDFRTLPLGHVEALIFIPHRRGAKVAQFDVWPVRPPSRAEFAYEKNIVRFQIGMYNGFCAAIVQYIQSFSQLNEDMPDEILRSLRPHMINSTLKVAAGAIFVDEDKEGGAGTLAAVIAVDEAGETGSAWEDDLEEVGFHGPSFGRHFIFRHRFVHG